MSFGCFAISDVIFSYLRINCREINEDTSFGLFVLCDDIKEDAVEGNKKRRTRNSLR